MFLAAALGIIIFGGVTRIARFAEIVVPFMALGYVIAALFVMVMNIGQLPSVIALIFKSALGSKRDLVRCWGLARYMQAAMESVVPGFGASLVAIA